MRPIDADVIIAKLRLIANYRLGARSAIIRP